ncbi:hypothetical protein BBJ28_00008309, partial [Nothophytophthora sp. Chile5]
MATLAAAREPLHPSASARRAHAPAASAAPPATIYDSYPLSLRTFLADGPPQPFVRALSQTQDDPTQTTMSLDDDDFLTSLHNTSSSIGSLDMGDTTAALPQKRSSARPNSLCSTFGKFHNEVFETKERSKVLSALRHRGKAAASAARAPRRVLRPAPSTFTADDVLRAGTLVKQGSWRRNWKTRFFILRSDWPSLSYFSSEEKLELLGEVPISEDTLILDRSNGGKGPFRFQIRTDSRTLLLEAESRDNQRRWMDSCQALADAIRASKFSVNTTSLSSTTGPPNGGRESQASARSTAPVPSQRSQRQLQPLEASATTSSWDDRESDGGSDLASPQQFLTTSSTHSGSSRSGLEPCGRLYDLSLAVLVRRGSKLVRALDAADRDRLGCFVAVSGWIRSRNAVVALGNTDAVKLATLAATVASSSSSDAPVAVPFSIVLTAELERFDQLRLTLCRTQLAQSPGNVQATLGVGRVALDDHLLGSVARVVAVPEGGSAPATSRTDQKHDDGAQLVVVQAFRSLAPQRVLPTSGVDMANTKYLIPTMLAAGRETTKLVAAAKLDLTTATPTRSSDVRTFLENDTFLPGHGLGAGDGVSGNLRFVAVDEILRVPRSTFALPVAFLDFLEEQALARSRTLQHRRKAATGRAAGRADTELAFLRLKQEEYLKQRQFLLRQEQRLLAEEQDGHFCHAASRAARVRVDESAVGATTTTTNAAAGSDNEPAAPFKRSTYKSLNLWQFLPTNMQDQFLCTYKPPPTTAVGSAGRPFVWHTMTMGCPAAHTKGFANGGYPDSVPMLSVDPTGGSLDDDESLLTSSSRGGRPDHAVTSPTSSRGGAASASSSGGSDDSLAALKLKLELQDRLAVIGSQILSGAAACVLASLDLAAGGSALHQLQLARATRFGFLVNFESLLSTQGKEFGMLEDFAAGARWLRGVFIQFRRHATAGTFFSLKTFTSPPRDAVEMSAAGSSGRECLVLTMGITEAQLAVLPGPLAAGQPFRMRCVLFTQGVNEKQSLVHAYKASAVKLQERINRDNLAELKRLYALYRRLRVEETESRVLASRRLRASSAAGLADSDEAAKALDRHDLEALDDLLVQIEHHICSPSNQYKKNVALLMDSS